MPGVAEQGQRSGPEAGSNFDARETKRQEQGPRQVWTGIVGVMHVAVVMVVPVAAIRRNRERARFIGAMRMRMELITHGQAIIAFLRPPQSRPAAPSPMCKHPHTTD